MRTLSALDLAFFLAESEGSPKHVAGLMRFAKPARATRNFARRLLDELKAYDEPTEPFDLVIRLTGLTGPRWARCEAFDIDQHVIYHKPQQSSSWRQVEEYVATLHEPLLDRSRPLWEYHLIDGIEGGQFAVYFKVHHAYADGMTMTTWLDKTLSARSADKSLRPVWCMPQRRSRRREESAPPLLRRIGELGSWSRDQLLTVGGMTKLLSQQVLERAGITHKAVSLQFNTTDRTPLTGAATSGRSIATACLDMGEVKAVCHGLRATLNHVALACIDGALHRYLEDIGYPVDHALTIQMPVNLRRDGDGPAGNAVGVALVELGTPAIDPLTRLQEIGHSLHKVRNQIDSVSGSALQQYTVLSALTLELIDKLQLNDRIPATGHTLVSNVPGPPGSLYLQGAKLLQNYPLSVLVPGLRSNITLFSCSGLLNFGIVATRDLQDLHLLGGYIEDEFGLLAAAAN